MAGLVLTSLVGVIPSLARYTPGALSTLAADVGLGHDAPDLPVAVIANVLLVAVASGAAWLVFRRKEL